MASAIPALNSPAILTTISICVVLVMLYGNLRGIREAGRAFAVPTYLFAGVMLLVIVVGLVREIFFTLPHWHVANAKLVYGYGVAPNHASLITFGLIFVLLRAFANGGSSLTGIEAVSNAVSVFRPSEGLNARKVLVAEGLILGTLVAGISWLAHVTHATPYLSGVPTVISQEASVVFGTSLFGHIMFIVVQAATALILYTGGNTSFNGFPFLANFVAEDAFLPRWLTKRGHRLVFSNGMIVLAVLSCALLAIAGSNVNSLVPFYALGVFTAFTLAGFGMARYHHLQRERGWRHKLVINFSAGVTSLVVVAIFAVVKFTEGAWLVLIVFAVGVPLLIRLNRQYRMESEVLEKIGTQRGVTGAPTAPSYSRRTVFVFVDDYDPGHAGRAAVRPQPAPDQHPRRALRARQCSGRQAQARLGACEHRNRARPGRLPGSAVGQGRGRDGAGRGQPARGRRDRGAAQAQLYAAARPAAARPHGRQDRKRGQPDPARRGHDRWPPRSPTPPGT